MERTNNVKEYTVTEELLASNMHSGSLQVLATPAVSAFFEEASAELAQDYLEGGFTTVGSNAFGRQSNSKKQPCRTQRQVLPL